MVLRVRAAALCSLTALVLSGAVPARAQPLALRTIVQAEMPARPNGLAVDAEDRIWLALQGASPSLGMVDARACAVRADCTPTEFALDDDATPRFVAVSRRDGSVWVTATVAGGGRVYRFDPATETLDRHDTPGQDPYDIAVDSRGVVWFTDLAEGTINSIRLGRVREEYRTPDESFSSPGVGALGLAVDSGNAVWCACGTDLVRLYKTFTLAQRTTIEVHPIPKARKPHGVFAQTPSRIWLLDQHASALSRYDRRTDTFDRWPLPAFLEGNLSVLVDPHWLVVRGSTLHFTAFAGVVGTFDTSRETFGGYVVSPYRQDPGGASGAYDVAVDSVGRVWLTEINADSLSRVATRRLPLPRAPVPGF